ncbi:hypothetical protein PZE02_003445 [Salmonella enterica subsp. enterica serovar Vitkin]|uniref:Uncharacterized protein n=3 Tax=Salmonella enterica TaxID=28901 RepID=A0A5Z6P5W4_SALET|nr:hypothetical protein [Salmonella enterica]EBG5369084.1 hypothetical protein [Salmonella enterica subsp. enterica serovar Monschaui]EBH8278967.1 hypothetical protein [Salmonella enterica subsp. enterica serovar Typhimurium str. UK-1]EBP3975258.1 hypothetical protein [Salmonella enterica subsp. enterica]EBS2690425.1 hypothetical protein [Salmonella enterica subsp. enterica serovar Muenchen]EBY0126209.1 hypothetical protein [Salmonella enterica subsp. enterica serovar Vitkin]EBY1916002.1 hypo
MTYYVNDTASGTTLLSCRTKKEASIYASWANECQGSCNIEAQECKYPIQSSGEQLLNYFGFTIDSLVDGLFTLMPTRSRAESNIVLIKTMLKDPSQSKSTCCIQANKYPTHYSRLSRTLSEHCAWVSLLSGGRNPMKLLRGVRGDL